MRLGRFAFRSTVASFTFSPPSSKVTPTSSKVAPPSFNIAVACFIITPPSFINRVAYFGTVQRNV